MIREEEPPRPSTRLSTRARRCRIDRGQPRHGAGQAGELVRGELDWIVMKALEKDRNRRYETANGFAADVQRYLDDEPVLACPPSAVLPLPQVRPAGNKAALLTAAALSLGVVLGDRQAWRRAVRVQAASNARDQGGTEADEGRPGSGEADQRSAHPFPRPRGAVQVFPGHRPGGARAGRRQRRPGRGAARRMPRPPARLGVAPPQAPPVRAAHLPGARLRGLGRRVQPRRQPRRVLEFPADVR